MFNTSYFNRDIVTNYRSKMSWGLILYQGEIENHKSYFHYNDKTNSEKRLLKIQSEI